MESGIVVIYGLGDLGVEKAAAMAEHASFTRRVYDKTLVSIGWIGL